MYETHEGVPRGICSAIVAEIPRIDVSQLTDLVGTAASANPSALIDQLQARAARAGELRERLRDLVGRAQSDDGTIEARFTARDGLAQLTLDPRAMRRASADLAADIVAVTAAARDDLARQRNEAATELGADTALPDMSQAQDDLRVLADEYRRGAGDIRALIERYRTQLGR